MIEANLGRHGFFLEYSIKRGEIQGVRKEAQRQEGNLRHFVARLRFQAVFFEEMQHSLNDRDSGLPAP